MGGPGAIVPKGKGERARMNLSVRTPVGVALGLCAVARRSRLRSFFSTSTARGRGVAGAWSMAILTSGFAWALPDIAIAQEGPPAVAADRLNVFLSCEGQHCDPEPYRTRITWVHWLDSPDSADVRVSMSSEPAPEGGTAFVLDFEVSENIEGEPDQLFFRSNPDDSEQDALNGIATTMAVGFARYSAIAGFREFVVVRATRRPGIDPRERIVSPQEVDDPWNLWVFTVGGRGNFSGSDTRTTRRLSYNFSANRTTPTWKLSFSGRGNINTQEIERADGSIFESDEKDFNLNVGITYALADHWSVDLSSLIAKLPRFNQDFHFGLTPGIEYSIFPYEEATRRTLTFRYTIGPTFRNYDEETVYNTTQEILWEEEGQIRATMRQPWGDLSVTATGSHYMDDFEKNNLSLRGNLSFRIVRGLSFNVGGDVSRVRDQVYLSNQGVTDEEALLRLRQRQSFSDKSLNFGLSYQFGSIYNNTVNNRFSGIGFGGGGGRGGEGGGGGGGGGRGG